MNRPTRIQPLLPVALDLDGCIATQPRLAQGMRVVEHMKYNGSEVRLFAEDKAAARLRDRITGLRRSHPGPWLTFFGSGDFHHVTLLLLETLDFSVEPITLVLIDNHPDWFHEHPQYHCGNWVSGALRILGISSVILVGQDSDDLTWRHAYAAPFEELCAGEIELIPLRRDQVRVPLKWPRANGPANFPKPVGFSAFSRFWGTELKFRTIRESGGAAVFNELSRRLAGSRVYLSVDKDCLIPEHAISDWEQGGLNADELIGGVRQFAERCDLVGADVCGDRAPEPLQGLRKRIDAGRLFTNRSSDSRSASEVNQAINLRLLEAFGIPTGAAIEELAS